MSLDSHLRKMKCKSQWYADGLAFECQQCGSCCAGDPGFVWINDEDLLAMSERLKMSADEFREKYCRISRAKLCLKERADGDCILLDEERRACMVYDLRPVQCRTWPWWPENLRSREIWNSRAEGCPGIGKGRLHSCSYIMDRVEADKKSS